MNVENNLLPVLYTFWLCEARPEWTDTCRLFLLEGQRKSFEYIKNSRDKGAYECMQRFTSYIMNSYIELDGGIPFRHYYEKFARSLFNEEFDLIRLHPQMGYELLNKWDSTRPCADCLDAATDSVGRAYSSSKNFADMLADLRCNAGRMFNPDLVQLFVSKISCRLLTSRIIRLYESRDCCTCLHGLIRNIAHGANTS